MKQNINRALKAAWIKACRYDSIDHRAKFVFFSDDNPHAHRYNKLMRMKLAGSTR